MLKGIHPQKVKVVEGAPSKLISNAVQLCVLQVRDLSFMSMDVEVSSHSSIEEFPELVEVKVRIFLKILFIRLLIKVCLITPFLWYLVVNQSTSDHIGILLSKEI